MYAHWWQVRALYQRPPPPRPSHRGRQVESGQSARAFLPFLTALMRAHQKQHTLRWQHKVSQRKKKQRGSAGWRDRGRGEHRWRVCSHITNLVIVDIEKRSGLFKSQVTIKQVRGWRGNGLTRLICTFLTDVNWLFFALFSSASASDMIQAIGPKSSQKVQNL